MIKLLRLMSTVPALLLAAACSEVPEANQTGPDFNAELEALAKQHEMTEEEVADLRSLLQRSIEAAQTGTIEGAGEGGPLTGSSDPLPQADGADGTDQVLATVNGQDITETIFQEAATRKRPSDGKALSTDEKREVLDELIEDALLYQQAQERGFQDNPKVQKVMVSSLLREDVYGKVRSSDFGDAELNAYFDAHYEEFIVPAKAQLRRILIRVDKDRTESAALEEATRIYRQIKEDPQSFKTLAGEFSEDSYRKRAGEVGFVTEEGKPGLDQGVVDMAFEMPTETLSEPFRSPDGYNIIYVVNKRDRIERDFKKMKGSVLRKVKTERLREMYDAYVLELEQRSEINVDENALSSIQVQGRARPVGAGVASAPVVPMGMDPESQEDNLGLEQNGPAEGNR
jgi:parvulin-like peptidyl-prolyl isomerase